MVAGLSAWHRITGGDQSGSIHPLSQRTAFVNDSGIAKRPYNRRAYLSCCAANSGIVVSRGTPRSWRRKDAGISCSYSLRSSRCSSCAQMAPENAPDTCLQHPGLRLARATLATNRCTKLGSRGAEATVLSDAHPTFCVCVLSDHRRSRDNSSGKNLGY